MVSVVGCSAPAPSPCSMRKAINSGTDTEKPHRMVPKRNRPKPPRKVARRPMPSASPPDKRTPSVEAKKKAVKTHAYSCRPPSSAVSVGMAVVTTVVSKAAITRPNSTATVAMRRAGPGARTSTLRPIRIAFTRQP